MKTPKKRKRVTDKQRLDWLQKNKLSLYHWGFNDGWNVYGWSDRGRFKTIRQAIDAMRRRVKA